MGGMNLDEALKQLDDEARCRLIQTLQNMSVVHDPPLGDLFGEAATEIFELMRANEALRERLREMERRLTAAELEL